MGDADLPYRAEYAKSGRASCKGCKDNIGKESLRLAAMVQSPFFDGKQPKWYHFACFFGKQKPASVADIAHFESLRFEDQEKIRQKIQSGGASSSANGNGKKKSDANKDELKEFQLEYSKSSGAKCQVCGEKLLKGSVRIGKRIYDNDRARAYGAYVGWHHMECFVGAREQLGFFESGSSLPGFKSLAKDDQIAVKKELVKLKAPKRKAEDVPDGGVDAKKPRDDDDKIKAALKKQSRILFGYRDSLKQLTKSEMQQLLEHNDQSVPSGEEPILDLLCDILSFGALQPCSVCKTGQFRFKSGRGYQCVGDLTNWTKCTNIEMKPARCKVRIPSGLATEYQFLKTYKCKLGERIMADLGERSLTKEQERKKKFDATPLHGLTFVLAAGVDSAVSERIRRMDGKVAKRVSAKVAAVVADRAVFDGGEDKAIKDAIQQDIHVISPETVTKLKTGSVFSMIEEQCFAPVGTKLSDRLGSTEQQILSERQQKSGSLARSMASGGVRRMRVKDGSAVDPDSGLEHEAHVQRGSDGAPLSAVLCCADAASDKNSYYRLQVLHSDGPNARSWLFRAWGRLGTGVGGSKLSRHDSVHDATSVFHSLYEEKTGNSWHMRSRFEKIPGRFYPMDLDMGNSEQLKQLTTENSSSLLPAAIQKLVCMVFDVSAMKRTMVEFEIDTDKMPLGKLSNQQLQQALTVLTEAQDLLKNAGDAGTPAAKGRLIDCSNRFFTLVPHNVGLNKLPLLDSLEMIKEKVDMVSNLMDIQLAYSMHRDAGKTEKDQDAAQDPIDCHYAKLKSDITVLKQESSEYKLLSDYVKNTHAQTHSHYSLSIEKIFCVDRHGEKTRYKPFSKLPNRKLLWHGSRITNFAGILSQGLRIAPPEAPVTGYMFGKGIYFADMVSKSANYCFATNKDPRGLLLLCEVALGNMYECKQAEYVTKLPAGKHSTKGVGKTWPNPSKSHFTESKVEVPIGTPQKSGVKDTSLLYNEYIVYDTAQVNVRYLLQVKFNFD